VIDLRYVKKLVEMLDESTVDSIEISTDKGMKIRLSKTPVQRAGIATPVAIAAPAPVAPLAAAPAALPDAAVPARVEEPRPTYLEVKSPMVGTYYGSPEPGAGPYVSVGDRIAKGQILCIIEAMKIMNEIESEFDGVLREMLVDNAQPVEYGQVLFRIERNG